MKAPPGVPAHWLSYVMVDSLDGAKARCTKLGGKIMVERIDVPAQGAFSVVQDFQGAMLAIFAA